MPPEGSSCNRRGKPLNSRCPAREEGGQLRAWDFGAGCHVAFWDAPLFMRFWVLSAIRTIFILRRDLGHAQASTTNIRFAWRSGHVLNPYSCHGTRPASLPYWHRHQPLPPSPQTRAPQPPPESQLANLPESSEPVCHHGYLQISSVLTFNSE